VLRCCFRSTTGAHQEYNFHFGRRRFHCSNSLLCQSDFQFHTQLCTLTMVNCVFVCVCVVLRQLWSHAMSRSLSEELGSGSALPRAGLTQVSCSYTSAQVYTQHHEYYEEDRVRLPEPCSCPVTVVQR
jgi:hypothetical protein